MPRRKSTTLAGRLQKALRSNAYTQADFARAAQITPAQASRYLSGKTAPTTAAVQGRIARALGLMPDWFSQ